MTRRAFGDGDRFDDLQGILRVAGFTHLLHFGEHSSHSDCKHHSAVGQETRENESTCGAHSSPHHWISCRVVM